MSGLSRADPPRPIVVQPLPEAPLRAARWPRHAWLLGLTMLAIIAPMLMELSVRGPKQWMEGVALLSSQETWQRLGAGESGAWLTPTKNGRPRVVKPPAVVWINLLAWTGLDPDTCRSSDLIGRARAASVGACLLMLLAAYWIGCVLADRVLGLLALAVAGALHFVHMQARLASYDMYLAAFAAIAVASGLWAMSPRRGPPTSARWLAGWALSGLALGLAWLTKGPLAIGLVVLPLGAAIAIAGQRRGAMILGLVAAVAVGAAVALPWYIFIASRVPTAWDSWLFEFRATGPNTQQSWSFYLVNLLRSTLPWTLWILASLAHPWLTSRGKERRDRLVPWLWFILLLVMFSASASKAIRYIIPIAPAVALMVALVWHDHEKRARQGTLRVREKLLGGLHWLSLLVASVLVGPFFASQEWLVAAGIIKGTVIDSIPWSLAVASVPALLAVALAGAWLHRQRGPAAGALATVAWTLIALAVYRYGFVRSADSMAAVEPTAAEIASITGEAPLLELRQEGHNLAHHQFLFYLRRTIPPLFADKLSRRLDGSEEEAFIMTPATDEASHTMTAMGCQFICRFEDKPGQARRLWRHEPSAPGPSVEPESR